MGDAITAITLAGSLFDGSWGRFWSTKTRETNGEAEKWTLFWEGKTSTTMIFGFKNLSFRRCRVETFSQMSSWMGYSWRWVGTWKWGGPLEQAGSDPVYLVQKHQICWSPASWSRVNFKSHIGRSNWRWKLSWGGARHLFTRYLCFQSCGTTGTREGLEKGISAYKLIEETFNSAWCQWWMDFWWRRSVDKQKHRLPRSSKHGGFLLRKDSDRIEWHPRKLNYDLETWYFRQCSNHPIFRCFASFWEGNYVSSWQIWSQANELVLYIFLMAEIPKELTQCKGGSPKTK